MKEVEFALQAHKQLEYWQKQNQKVFERIENLLIDIQLHPFSGKGKPEALKHQLKGYWSRRITREHRLVYKISDDTIFVISCMYHY